MARRIVLRLLCVAWGLWLGGTIALFVLITNLFHHHTAVFHQAAPILFHTFERYQLFLAAGAVCLAGIAWYLKPKKTFMILWMLLCLSAAASVTSFAIVTPRMETLRLQGLTESPRFLALHGISMGIYLAQTIALLASAWFLPGLED